MRSGNIEDLGSRSDYYIGDDDPKATRKAMGEKSPPDSKEVDWNPSPTKDATLNLSVGEYAKKETERLKMPPPIPSIQEIQKEEMSPKKSFQSPEKMLMAHDFNSNREEPGTLNQDQATIIRQELEKKYETMIGKINDEY